MFPFNVLMIYKILNMDSYINVTNENTIEPKYTERNTITMFSRYLALQMLRPISSQNSLTTILPIFHILLFYDYNQIP